MQFRFVILAAGKGSRMGSDTPKALTLVNGRPILSYLVEATKVSGMDGIPVVVVGHGKERICEAFGETCDYVVQEEQLGTGHAVKSAKLAVQDADALVVFYGDHPFISAQTIQHLTKQHEERGNTITMMTAMLPSFDGWYRAFMHWSRILRGPDGHIVGDRQYKDATEEERKILEVNPCLFCFKTSWLWENIEKLQNQNSQSEYYLTDLIGMAVSQGEKISSIDVAPEEVMGINTPEELAIAEGILKNMYGT